MTTDLPAITDTPFDHMRRETDRGGPWVCVCRGCLDLRTLVGMEKVLNLRPLVREIQDAREQLEHLSEGPERQSLRERYLILHDRLAAAVAG